MTTQGRMADFPAESVLPMDLRLALVLGDAALRGEMSWSEIDEVQSSLDRLEDVDRERFWQIYQRLAPAQTPVPERFRLVRSA